MPRVTPRETAQSRYRGAIKGSMEAKGIRSIKELSKKTGIPYRTLVARLQSDAGTNSFRLYEMVALKKVLEVFPE